MNLVAVFMSKVTCNWKDPQVHKTYWNGTHKLSFSVHDSAISWGVDILSINLFAKLRARDYFVINIFEKLNNDLYLQQNDVWWVCLSLIE